MDTKKLMEKVLEQLGLSPFVHKQDEEDKLIHGKRTQSKSMGLHFRHTKRYADDRQKAPQNRRKYGMRKRK